MPEMPIDFDPDQGGEPEPDLAELQQRADHSPAVLVEHNGPIGVQQLPRNLTACRSFNVGTAPQQIVGRDLRRARIVLKVAAGSLAVGSYADVFATTGYVLEATANLELFHHEAIWVAGVFGSPVLSMLIESWAD
jgi:hypothetical protein